MLKSTSLYMEDQVFKLRSSRPESSIISATQSFLWGNEKWWKLSTSYKSSNNNINKTGCQRIKAVSI